MIVLSILAFTILTCEDSESRISRISSGTSFGECVGYCQRELIVTEGHISYKATRNDLVNYPALETDTTFQNQEWLALTALVDFDALLSHEDVLGCPDCTDGGAEWIEVVLDGQSKKITFEYGDSLDTIQDLIDEIRRLRNRFEQELFYE
jgi:hypothetical protein